MSRYRQYLAIFQCYKPSRWIWCEVHRSCQNRCTPILTSILNSSGGLGGDQLYTPNSTRRQLDTKTRHRTTVHAVTSTLNNSALRTVHYIFTGLHKRCTPDNCNRGQLYTKKIYTENCTFKLYFKIVTTERQSAVHSGKTTVKTRHAEKSTRKTWHQKLYTSIVISIL